MKLSEAGYQLLNSVYSLLLYILLFISITVSTKIIDVILSRFTQERKFLNYFILVIIIMLNTRSGSTVR